MQIYFTAVFDHIYQGCE